MKGTTAQKIKIGIVTQPINSNDPACQNPDQYILDINRQFIELSGLATAVPLRYDLILDESILKKTLDDLDGVLFTGGFLSLRVYKYAPESVKTFYATAKYVFQYAINHRLPVLGICQGFQLIQLLVADLHEEEANEVHTANLVSQLNKLEA